MPITAHLSRTNVFFPNHADPLATPRAFHLAPASMCARAAARRSAVVAPGAQAGTQNNHFFNSLSGGQRACVKRRLQLGRK